MKVRLKLARVGMQMQEAMITEWFKQPGDSFTAGDPLYAIETDKVVHEVTATGRGILIEILVQAGESPAVGDPVCVVDAERQ